MQEISIGERKYNVEKTESTGAVSINGLERNADISALGMGHFHMLLDGKSYSIEVIESDLQNPIIKVNGVVYQPSIKGETDLLLERLGMNTKAKKEVKELKAPMPGLVLSFRVKPGDEVKEGDPLVVLEAMKMENVLKSPADVRIRSLSVNIGDAIDKNTVLITFE